MAKAALRRLTKRTGLCRRILVTALAGAMTLTMTACGNSSTEGQIGNAKVNIEPYSKVEFNKVTVQSGDIQSSLSLDLKPDGYSSKDYSIQQSDYQVQKVYVKEGDKVKKGTVMIQFKAPEIQKLIDEYTEQKAQSQFSIEHYRKLAEIDKSQDYSGEIASANQEIELANTYIKEQKKQMKQYQLIAKKEGTVTFVNNDLQYGYVTMGDTLVTVESGASNYVTETNDPYEFKLGEKYNADYQEATYTLELIKCDKFKSDATGENMQRLTFKPVSDMTGVTEADTLKMVIQKPVVKNVVYINKKSVMQGNDGKYYVYTVNEDGYRVPVEVTIGDTVDDNTIIKTGLKAGDQVVAN